MGNPGKTGPSLAWLAVPCLLMVAALVLAGFGLSSFRSFVSSDFVAYQPNTPISVSGNGFTLYAGEGSSEPIDLQCQATGAGTVVQLRTVSGRSTLSNSRGRFVAIASTPPDFTAGRYLIACVSTSGMDVPLYVGPRFDIGAVARLVVFNIIAPLFLGVCAVVIFAILLILRYRSRSKPSQTGTPAAPA